jgi:hypothetical protein
MYQRTEEQLRLENFHLPFSGKLDPNNRWAKLAQLIPWDMFEAKYAARFSGSRMGARAKPVRMALGSLIIKERCGFSDEETVEQIQENPYLQYFIGLPEFQIKAPFDPSLMVHFRKRLRAKVINEVNEIISGVQPEKPKDPNDEPPEASSGDGNQGTLILDATCAPADIRYPTDCSLLNEAREKLEAMIDKLYEPLKNQIIKPRTYRQKARKDYLNLAKAKKPKPAFIRRSIGKQLRYIKRDLKAIDWLLGKNLEGLSSKQRNDLEVILTLYEQQKEMYETHSHRIEDRVVSISQPHVRPIVRGKAVADTEFGAKISVSLVNGYAFIDKLSWDSFHEGVELKDYVELYRRRFGFDPEAVIVDKLYRTHENIQFCKSRHIRLSGPKLGRPKREADKKQRRIERLDSKVRNSIEGKFGEGKRCYGLNRIMAKLKTTSETVIALQFLVMNLEHKLRVLLRHFFKVLFFNVLIGFDDFFTAA